MFPGESKFGGSAVREEGVSETRRLSAWGRSSEKVLRGREGFLSFRSEESPRQESGTRSATLRNF